MSEVKQVEDTFHDHPNGNGMADSFHDHPNGNDMTGDARAPSKNPQKNKANVNFPHEFDTNILNDFQRNNSRRIADIVSNPRLRTNTP